MNANPELVGAAQLAAWAGTPTARTELPRLLRKLLAATPGVSEVSAPAGASVGRRGRDAYVDGGRGTPFVPRGKSVWEMGTSSDPGRKAQRDYRNRTRSPGGLDISRNTFVFVTPRPWDGKDAWRARKLQEKKWRGVRVLDVDDVEAWLEEVPAVHIWLSELLGLRPRDARTLETWWREWSDGLRVPLPPGVLLAGREEAAEALRRRLAAEPAVIARPSKLSRRGGRVYRGDIGSPHRRRS